MESEKKSIVEYALQNPLDGYRRLTYMMMDADIAAVSPTSVYRVLSEAKLLKRWNTRKNSKGTGFKQPRSPHSHWHTDIAYINVCGTFYFLCSVLDGYSRAILHWELKEQMTEADVELVLQKCIEKYPTAKARVISDNGPQFVAREFKNFIRETGLTHVRTAPYYPQSNGKIERFHRTIKHEAIRTKTPLCLEDAKRIITNFVDKYNNERLHSAVGYITPADMLAGKQAQIHQARDLKLETARLLRKQARQEALQQAAA